MTRPVLLDTDLGSDVDDAIALAVLLACPELRLVALTTVAGDVAGRAEASARLLALAGAKDVDVCVGAADALARRKRFNAEPIPIDAYPDEAPRVSDEPAPERIVRAARETPGLEIFMIGPLTNLAHALVLDPDLPKRVARLHVMGGHIRRVAIGSLLAKPGIDYNLCSDPEASVMVLGAGFETRLVTADVTLQTWLREADLARLAGSTSPVARALVPLIRAWTPVQQGIFVKGLGGTLAPDNVAFLHDPLTVWAAVDPSSLHFERLPIVTTIERGVLRTLEVSPDAGIGATMEVALTVDAERARAEMVERLLSGR
ncbi:MAG: nucleoside hydrolase [Myxococcota bacterium]